MRGRDERGDRGDLGRRAERREDPHSSIAPAGGLPDSDSAADVAALPPELAGRSLTTSRVTLSLPDAVRAIEHLAANGRRLQSWEGWVRMRDGSRARSLTHAGSFALPRDAGRAVEVARTGMERAQARWDRDPEYPNAQLFFALTFEPLT
jgi:hypothetical protein